MLKATSFCDSKFDQTEIIKKRYQRFMNQDKILKEVELLQPKQHFLISESELNTQLKRLIRLTAKENGFRVSITKLQLTKMQSNRDLNIMIYRS